MQIPVLFCSVKHTLLYRKWLKRFGKHVFCGQRAFLTSWIKKILKCIIRVSKFLSHIIIKLTKIQLRKL